MAQLFEQEMACGPATVSEGRRLVARALSAWTGPDPGAGAPLCRSVLLVVTELLAAAAWSGAETVLLRVHAEGRHVRVGAADDSPSSELPVQVPDNDIGHWNCALVAAVSDCSGETFYDAELREAWALVPIPSGLALGAAHG